MWQDICLCAASKVDGTLDWGFILNSTAKTILFWVVMLVTAVLLYSVVQRTTQRKQHGLHLQPIPAGSRARQRQGRHDCRLGHHRALMTQVVEAFKTVMPMEYPELINMLRAKQSRLRAKSRVRVPGWRPWFRGRRSFSLSVSGFSSCARCRAAATKPFPSARAAHAC